MRNQQVPVWRRKGFVAVFVAVSMVFILGVTAIAIDGGGLLDRRRHAQATADAASMAGASILSSKYPKYNGLDGDGAARAAALAVAASNGFANDDTTSTVT